MYVCVWHVYMDAIDKKVSYFIDISYGLVR